MAQNFTFEQILKAQLGASNSPSENDVYIEEDQALWVQVLPFIQRSKWEFKRPVSYPHTPRVATKAATQVAAPVIETPVVETKPEPKLSVATLGIIELAKLELLIRRGWITRQDVYEATYWKKAHRKAVKALHPDQNDMSKNLEFSEVHEGFKSLRSLFQ